MTENNTSPVFTRQERRGRIRPTVDLPLGFVLFVALSLSIGSLFAATDSIVEGNPADTAIGDSALSASAEDSIIQRLSLDRSSDPASDEPLDLSYNKPGNIFSAKNISMVLIVLGLLILFLHLLRKFLFRPLSGDTQGEQFRVIRQFHLGPKKSVTLVRFFDRLLLLGITDSNINTLAEIDDPDEIGRILSQASKTNAEQGGGFKEIYQNLLSRGKKDS